MKNIAAFLVGFALFFFANVGWAVECSENISEEMVTQISSETDCQDPNLAPAERGECKYCQIIWKVQPIMEVLGLSITGLKYIKGSCVGFAAGIAIDTYWLSLACRCNQDVVGCATWAYDFAYNIYMYSSLCR